MTQQVWEQFYKKRGRYYLEVHPAFVRIASRLKRFNVRKVLDLGCGSGRHSIYLAKDDFTVVGIDFSKEALALAKKWADSLKKKIAFVLGNIHEKLPFPDKSFDAVIAIDSLGYHSTSALDFTLGEISRILREGGLLFITLPVESLVPLVIHLIFSEEEIKNLLTRKFQIIDSFLDESKYLCVLAIKGSTTARYA